MIRKLPLKPIYLAFLLVLLQLFLVTRQLAVLPLFLLALVSLWRQYEKKSLFQVLACLFLFGTYSSYRQYLSDQASRQQAQSLTAIRLVPDSIQINGDSLSFRGQWQGKTYQTFYQLKSQKEQDFFAQLTQPVQLEIEANLEMPTGQRNFKGFDYQAYLKQAGIYRLAKIERIKGIKAVWDWRLTLSTWRRQALVHIQQNFPAPMRHYMTGLLFGYLDKSFDQMSDLYSSLGIIHLFALSGMQVGFFMGLFRYVLLRLGLRMDWVDYLQIPFSLIYAGLTGFSVSVIRSLIQAGLGRLGIKGQDNLGLTALIFLVIWSEFVLNPGAVLSFSYALIISFINLENLGKIKGLLVESLTISLGILPLLMLYFASFQPFSILLTALFSILFDLVMLPALTLAFLISPLHVAGWLNPLFEGLEFLISQLGTWLVRPLVLGRPGPWLFLALVLILMFLGDNFQSRPARRGLLMLFLTCLFLVKHPLENEVTVVDIGQGDSIFLRDSWGKTILIDVGGRVSFSKKEDWQERQTDANAQNTLIPYLYNRGVGKIDQLVLTHTDTDHIGDLEVVAKAVAIGEILVSPGSLTNPDFVSRLKALKIPVRVSQPGQQLEIMGSRLSVLYPLTTGDGGNDDSLVLYGKLLGKNFLFTGDLEEKGEKNLIETYPNLPVDVLKAGHHGSKGSSSPDFLSHIQAKIALVSAGQNNRYQHPHQETLDRFQRELMTVYRTDQQGAIRFSGLWNWRIETVRDFSE